MLFQNELKMFKKMIENMKKKKNPPKVNYENPKMKWQTQEKN